MRPSLPGDSSKQFAYAQGPKDSIVIPKLDMDFTLDSKYLSKKTGNEKRLGSGSRRTSSGRRRFNGDATRPHDYFLQLYQRIKGARGIFLS